MAKKGDDTEKKEFPPSLVKLKKLREEGTVAHSKELPPALSLIAVAAFLYVTLGSKIGQLWNGFDLAFDGIDRLDATPWLHTQPWMVTLGNMTSLLGTIVIPVFGAALVISIMASILDAGGFIISFKTLSPDFSRFNPADGLKKIFELASLAELLKQTVKLILIIVAALTIISYMLNSLFWAPTCGETCSLGVAGYLAVAVGLAAAVVIMLGAVADLKISRLLFRHDNRMTRTEMKRENKDSFGDPTMRQARRRAARAQSGPRKQ